MDDFDETAAIAQLSTAVHQLAGAVETLHQQYLEIRQTLAPRAVAAGRGQLQSQPCWADLDREAAAEVWDWLIDWTGWLVDRYQLTEEIPACWHRHPPLVEELTALGTAWLTTYDTAGLTDGALLWHERLARARDRLRDWDDATRCRNGVHADRSVDFGWPDRWKDEALDSVDADLAGRPEPATIATDKEQS